jgi:hypothetical protein
LSLEIIPQDGVLDKTTHTVSEVKSMVGQLGGKGTRASNNNLQTLQDIVENTASQNLLINTTVPHTETITINNDTPLIDSQGTTRRTSDDIENEFGNYTLT